MSLSRPVVVVTGASSGIGRATAHRYAARGARLVLACRSEDALLEVAAECRERGGDVAVVPADVADADAVTRLAEAADDTFGRIDVWVHSAAVMAYGRFEDVPPEVWNRVVDTEVYGVVHAAREVLPRFQRQDGGGVLVVVGSVLGATAAPTMSAYVTSKWAVRGLCRVLDIEARSTPGVRVRHVEPGAVDTPIYAQAGNYTGRVPVPPPPVDSPERVARAIEQAADGSSHRVSVGLANPLMRLGFSLVPGVYDALVTPLMRRFGFTDAPAADSPGNVLAPYPAAEALRGQPPSVRTAVR